MKDCHWDSGAFFKNRNEEEIITRIQDREEKSEMGPSQFKRISDDSMYMCMVDVWYMMIIFNAYVKYAIVYISI